MLWQKLINAIAEEGRMGNGDHESGAGLGGAVRNIKNVWAELASLRS